MLSGLLRGGGSSGEAWQMPTGGASAKEDGTPSPSTRPENPLASAGSSPQAVELSGEDKTKAAHHDVLEMMRSYSEETRGMSATFQKCLQQNQDQHQKVFGEISNFLQATTQNQKAQKEKPIVLSAASIQSLASLLNGASGGASGGNGASVHAVNVAEQEENGAGPGATSSASVPAVGGANSAPVNSIKGTFDAINRNLHRLVHESSSKADAQKSLSTLVMILTNVLNNPSSEKHRKVNTSSQRFKVLKQGAGAELLKLAGFEYQEPNFNLPVEQDTGSAQNTKDLTQALQRDIDQVWAARPTDAPPGQAAVAEAAPPAPPAETPAIAHPAEAVPVTQPPARPSASACDQAAQPALLESAVVAHPAESQDPSPAVGGEAAPMLAAAPAHPAEAVDQQAPFFSGGGGPVAEEPQPHCGG